MTFAIRTRGLTKRYDDVAAVDGLDLEVERGALYGFLGPNGAGKTTTIRMALGSDPRRPRGRSRSWASRWGPTADRSSGSARWSRSRRSTGTCRDGGTWSTSRVRAAGATTPAAGWRASTRVSRRSGCTDAADKRVKAYSQGMRQRLGIGLALLGEPELLMLDEPTNGLDPTGMREMRQLLRGLADGGTTVFVSSHLLAEVEAMCDRVGVMAQGRIVAEGPPGTLRGAADRVRIEVDDVQAARIIAERTPGVSVASASGEGSGVINVVLSGDATPAALNGALVAAGIRVNALVPERDTLEDVFLHLVEGIDVPRSRSARRIRRWRTWLLAAALAGVPVLIVIAVKASPPQPQNAQDAPPFLLQIVRNGMFAPLTGLAVVQPFFLSLAIGLFAGDAVAGEAQSGTLRYLLVRPVRRGRMLRAKYLSAMTLTGALLVGVILAGLLAGGVVFGFGPLPTLSGTTLTTWEALFRVIGSGAYILVAASGIMAIGLFISTLTDSGPGRDRRHGDRRDREPGGRPDPEPARAAPVHADQRLARVHGVVPVPGRLERHACGLDRERRLHGGLHAPRRVEPPPTRHHVLVRREPAWPRGRR